MPTTGELSLYIHVPFCQKKCPYCSFFVLPNKKEHQKLWFEALLQEISLLQDEINQHFVLTLYFGGGTPSLIPPEWVETILSLLPNRPQEVTLEANPEDISLDKLRSFFQAGINRLSLGVQSFHDEELAQLGRVHNKDKAIQSVWLAKEAGFDNLSIDLMYDLPHLTLEKWQSTLEQAATLPIDHLSLYNLTLEPTTPFYKKRETLTPLQPSQEESARMYQLAVSLLASHGFSRYEISAFCKGLKESLHNTGYWKARSFLGLGPSASSYYQGKRYKNFSSLTHYRQQLNGGQLPIESEDILPFESRIRELFVIQLRLTKGVDLQNFETKFAPLPINMLQQLEKLTSIGWIQDPHTVPKLTETGVLFFDTIAQELI